MRFYKRTTFGERKEETFALFFNFSDTALVYFNLTNKKQKDNFHCKNSECFLLKSHCKLLQGDKFIEKNAKLKC